MLLLPAPAAHASAWRPPVDRRLDARTGHAATWSRPVEGPLLRAFALGRDPYAGGWHRGVDLAAPRGSPVRSACAGRVSFAGRVPRGGQTVSVRCGALVATVAHLRALAVRAGARVARGTRLGTVGASSDPRQLRPHVHLGARDLATGRYLDPLDLLRAAPPAIPLVPPGTRAPPRAGPLGPAPGSPRLAPVRPVPGLPRLAPVRPVPGLPRLAPVRPVPGSPRLAPVRPVPGSPRLAPVRPVPGSPRLAPVRPVPGSPRLAPVRPEPLAPTVAPAPPSPAGPPPGVPWLVWMGLACVGLALPIGGLVRHRRRERVARRIARTA